MHPLPERLETTDSKVLRRAAGGWIRDLRIARGLTQRQLADAVGIAYYTFVSQIEAGKGRVPPESYEVWATALDVPLVEFVRTLMAYYDPYTHRALFSAKDA